MINRDWFWQWSSRIARIVATITTLWISYIVIRLLIEGQKIVGVTEGPPGSQVGQLPQLVSYESYPLAYGYLPAVLLLLVGLWVRNWSRLAWIGLGWLALWSTILLFSSGATFIPTLVLLLICLILIHGITRFRNQRRI